MIGAGNFPTQNRRYNDRPRAVTVDEIADERRFDGALRARQRKCQRRCRPTDSEIPLIGRKKTVKPNWCRPPPTTRMADTNPTMCQP